MIDPKAITTYAQYNEDLILYALLRNVKEGFYVDVGANYPVIDSVTKLFYDKDWHGINIEPIIGLHAELEKARPRDLNLQCGAGSSVATAKLREYTTVPGWSTFDPKQQKQADLPYQEYAVDIMPLRDIFKEAQVTNIDFIKIDVEGYEYEVVAGNDWKKYRPKVICIEANHIHRDWRPLLKAADYKLFVSDGLNDYYVSKEHWSLTNSYAERIVALDYRALKQHQIQSWRKDDLDLVSVLESAENMKQRIVELEHENQKTRQELQKKASLSLTDLPLRSRLKRAAYGVSIDWLKYKRQ
jgi:FkbM family methyltransferase